MRRLALAVCMVAGLAAGVGPGTWAAAPEPVRRAVLGKPTAPVEMEVVMLDASPDAGRFRAEIRVTALADHEALVLTLWGAPGVLLDDAAPAVLGPGSAGRQVSLRLAGEWTSEGPPRVYVQAELLTAAGKVSRRLAVTVSEADFSRPTAGRLDEANGVLVLGEE